jgi:hypothetical protein
MKLARCLVLPVLMVAACGSPSEAPTISETCGLSPEVLDTFIPVEAGAFVKGKDPVYPEEAPTLTTAHRCIRTALP